MRRVIAGLLLVGLLVGHTGCIALGAAAVGAGLGAEGAYWWGTVKEKDKDKDKKEESHAQPELR